MGGNDEYYDISYNETFPGYTVESVNPSSTLLVIVTCFSALCIVTSLIFKYLKERQKESGADTLYVEAGSCIGSVTSKSSKFVVDTVTSLDLFIWESDTVSSSHGRTKKRRPSSRCLHGNRPTSSSSVRYFQAKKFPESTAGGLTPLSSRRSIYSEKSVSQQSTVNDAESISTVEKLKLVAKDLRTDSSRRSLQSEKSVSQQSIPSAAGSASGVKRNSARNVELKSKNTESQSSNYELLEESETEKKDKNNEDLQSMMESNALSVELKSNNHESRSSYHELSDESEIDSQSEGSEENELSFDDEIKKMVKLALPWAFSSFVENFASIVRICIISHFMGTVEMICYSYTWFIISISSVVSEALYSSLYKHVNNAVALETEEGNTTAGKYIRIGMCINLFNSLLVNAVLITTIAPIMRLYGYGEQIALLSQNYMYIAAVNDLLTSSISFPALIPDIIGHADFDAMFGLVDAGIDISITILLVPKFQLTLLHLGLIHMVHDVLSVILYYWITWYWNQWFAEYKKGITNVLDIQISSCNLFSRNSFKGKDVELVISLIKKTIPLTFDAVAAELEFFLLTFFAAVLGPAESATWILISYIWEFVNILPTSIASASEYSVSNLLSKNNIEMAKQVASMSIWITIASSTVSCLILFYARNPIVKAVTNDETLDEMLLEIISYIVLCDPILSLSTSISYLNRALAMYKRSTKAEMLFTVTVTIPLAALFTYVYNFNVEGIAAASYLGGATMALIIVMVYANADWENAVKKNKIMSGEYFLKNDC